MCYTYQLHHYIMVKTIYHNGKKALFVIKVVIMTKNVHHKTCPPHRSEINIWQITMAKAWEFLCCWVCSWYHEKNIPLSSSLFPRLLPHHAKPSQCLLSFIDHTELQFAVFVAWHLANKPRHEQLYVATCTGHYNKTNK